MLLSTTTAVGAHTNNNNNNTNSNNNPINNNNAYRAIQVLPRTNSNQTHVFGYRKLTMVFSFSNLAFFHPITLVLPLSSTSILSLCVCLFCELFTFFSRQSEKFHYTSELCIYSWQSILNAKEPWKAQTQQKHAHTHTHTQWINTFGKRAVSEHVPSYTVHITFLV